MYIRAAIIDDINNGLLKILEEFNELDYIDKEHLDIAFLSTSGIIFVMVDGNEVIGTGTLVIEQKFVNQRRVAKIEEVVIADHRRGQGLGKQLIAFLVNEAKFRRCYKVILNCSDDNVEFYEKCNLYHSSNCMRIDLTP